MCSAGGRGSKEQKQANCAVRKPRLQALRCTGPSKAQGKDLSILHDFTFFLKKASKLFTFPAPQNLDPPFHGLNLFPQNLCVEALTPNATVFGTGVLEEVILVK